MLNINCDPGKLRSLLKSRINIIGDVIPLFSKHENQVSQRWIFVIIHNHFQNLAKDCSHSLK